MRSGPGMGSSISGKTSSIGCIDLRSATNPLADRFDRQTIAVAVHLPYCPQLEFDGNPNRLVAAIAEQPDVSLRKCLGSGIFQ
jgi:hypothetical protein